MGDLHRRHSTTFFLLRQVYFYQSSGDAIFANDCFCTVHPTVALWIIWFMFMVDILVTRMTISLKMDLVINCSAWTWKHFVGRNFQEAHTILKGWKNQVLSTIKIISFFMEVMVKLRNQINSTQEKCILILTRHLSGTGNEAGMGTFGHFPFRRKLGIGPKSREQFQNLEQVSHFCIKCVIWQKLGLTTFYLWAIIL